MPVSFSIKDLANLEREDVRLWAAIHDIERRTKAARVQSSNNNKEVGTLEKTTKMKVVETSDSNYTIQDDDTLIRADSSSNVVNINMPSAADAFTNGVGRQIIIKRVNTGLNAVNVLVGALGDLIEGLTSLSLATQYDVRTLVSNGTSWDII